MEENEYVTYQEALWLKDLKFDDPCEYYYNAKKERVFSKWTALSPQFVNNAYLDEIADCIATSPTLMHIVKWFRETYNIIIWVIPYVNNGIIDDEAWQFIIYKDDKKYKISDDIFYKSPETAYHFAINFIFENWY